MHPTWCDIANLMAQHDHSMAKHIASVKIVMTVRKSSGRVLKLACIPCSLTAHLSKAQHSTAQHSTAQHSTAQHSTAQHSSSPDQDQ